ncbi:MAG: transposase [Janthinobacterium lividum]
MAVDSAEGVISHIQADFANKRDSQCLPSIVTELQARLKDNELVVANLLADTNYSNGYNYSLLEQKGITGWVPVFGKYKPVSEGFPYNKEKDEYSCPMNKPLLFKGLYKNLDDTLLKNYSASGKDCRTCPNKSSCAPNTLRRKITRTVYDEQYLRAYARQHSRRGHQMKKLRQSKVEPVFGSLTQYYGLRRIGVLGRAGAHKVMLMAAIAFNLKKYLKNGGRKPSCANFKGIIQAFEQAMLALLSFLGNSYRFS